MYFANTRSMIIHYPECRHAGRIADRNFAGFLRLDDAIKAGYRHCKCCDLMTRRVSRHSEEMTKFCREKKMRYKAVDGVLSINTPYSQWRVYIGEEKNYDLYHKNTQGNIRKYHLQMNNITDLMSILHYIDSHDKFRLSNPLPKNPKRKSAPKKGTKRYKTMMRKAEAAKKRNDARRVLALIDALEAV